MYQFQNFWATRKEGRGPRKWETYLKGGVKLWGFRTLNEAKIALRNNFEDFTRV